MKYKSEISVVFLALALRLPYLNFWPPFLYDEGDLIEAGISFNHGCWGICTFGPTFFPPLSPLMASVVTFFSTTVWAQRIPDVIFGSLSCLVLYYILRNYNKKLALLSAILLAISPTVFINRTTESVNGTELFFLLTILYYVRFRSTGQNKYWLLAGVCSGISFLFDYIGVAAFFFLLFQSVIDHKRPVVKYLYMLLVGIAVASLFAVQGIENFNYFLKELLQYGHAPSITTAIRNFILGYPSGLLVSQEFMYISELFILVGFFASLYSLRNLGKPLLISALLSTFIVFILSGYLFFWIDFVLLIPIYCISLANLILLIGVKRVTIPAKVLAMITVMLVFTSLTFYYGTTVEVSNQGVDCTISYFKNSTSLTAAAPYISTNIPHGYNYAEVIYYNTHFSYHEWYTNMSVIFSVNLSITRFTYFVIDDTLLIIGTDQNITYHSPVIENFITSIENNWTLVQTCDQYKIYKQTPIS